MQQVQVDGEHTGHRYALVLQYTTTRIVVELT